MAEHSPIETDYQQEVIETPARPVEASELEDPQFGAWLVDPASHGG